MILDRLLPSQVLATPARNGDPRVGNLIGRQLQSDTAVVIVGFPTDAGVVRNGGRAGAAGGPAAVRGALYRLTPDAENSSASASLWRRTVDLGDVPVTGDLASDQALLGEIIGALFRRGVTPIVVGGGHETAFGHFLGYVAVEETVRIVNIDAHLDVRELVAAGGHSGSPFREALEHPSQRCAGYTVMGVEPHTCAAEHRDFVERVHSGRCIFRSATTVSEIDSVVQGASEPTLVSFDLDAVDESAAPGVSAPSVPGLSVDLWLYAAWSAGLNPAVHSFDLVECNPVCDIDNRTARLGALTIWHFLKGLTQRLPR